MSLGLKVSTTFRLHFLVFLWGFTGVIGKLISIEALPLVWYRLAFTLVCIGLYMWVRKISFREVRHHIFPLLGIGALIGVHWFLFFLSIKISNVSIALSTLSTGAFFSALLEPIFFKRKIDVFELCISIIVIACMMAIFELEMKYMWGIICGISCTLFSVLFSILNTKFIRTHQGSATRYSFYEIFGALLIISLMLIWEKDLSSLSHISSNDIIWLFLLGSLLTAYPTIESIQLLKKINPFTMLLALNLEPVYGIILAYFIFPDSEKMQPKFYLVVVILVSSIILNEYLKRKLKQGRWRKIHP